MILRIFHCFWNQFATSDSEYEAKKITRELKTLEILSGTYNYNQGMIWDKIKSFLKNQDSKSNLLISSFLRWQVVTLSV